MALHVKVIGIIWWVLKPNRKAFDKHFSAETCQWLASVQAKGELEKLRSHPPKGCTSLYADAISEWVPKAASCITRLYLVVPGDAPTEWHEQRFKGWVIAIVERILMHAGDLETVGITDVPRGGGELDGAPQYHTMREIAQKLPGSDLNQLRKKPNTRQQREIEQKFPPQRCEHASKLPRAYPPHAIGSCEVYCTQDQFPDVMSWARANLTLSIDFVSKPKPDSRGKQQQQGKKGKSRKNAGERETRTKTTTQVSLGAYHAPPSPRHGGKRHD